MYCSEKKRLLQPDPDKPELKKSSRKNVIVKFAIFSQSLFSSPQRRRVRREKQFIFTEISVNIRLMSKLQKSMIVIPAEAGIQYFQTGFVFNYA